MTNSLHSVNLVTPTNVQTEKAKATQVKNNAGGFSFKVSDDDMFMRFLTMGTTGGTYYVDERKLTNDTVAFVQKYIAANGVKAVETIVRVSDQALAPKNTEALFALAIAFKVDDLDTKAAAKAALPKVARTATHLFEFASFIEATSGWGRAKTTAVANWYTDKTADQVAFQAVKYRSRHGFTHRDLLRLSHPKGLDSQVVNFILDKPVEIVGEDGLAPEIITAFKLLQKATSEDQVVKLLKQFTKATWEMIPTEFLNSAKVWRTLFENGMGQTALLRNVTRMQKLGLFDDLKFAGDYAAQLSNAKAIEKGRLHPINYLNAYVKYAGDPDPYYSRYSWNRSDKPVSNSKIADAINTGYDLAFKNVVPANKRTLIGLDVSGSMSSNAHGLQISCATLGAAFSQTVMKREPYSMVRGFSNQFVDLGIKDSDSLAEVLRKTHGLPFNSTDCALPMNWALKNGIEIDTFVVFTDNETWAGRNGHTHEALNKYRKATGIDARMVVVAASGTEFTIADPEDKGSMDVSGFDSSAIKLITDFSAGRI